MRFTVLESSRPPASPQNLSNGCGTWFVVIKVCFLLKKYVCFVKNTAGGRHAPKNRVFCHKSVFSVKTMLFFGETKTAGGRRAPKNRAFHHKSVFFALVEEEDLLFVEE